MHDPVQASTKRRRATQNEEQREGLAESGWNLPDVSTRDLQEFELHATRIECQYLSYIRKKSIRRITSHLELHLQHHSACDHEAYTNTEPCQPAIEPHRLPS